MSVNWAKMYQIKANNSEITPYTLDLDNVCKHLKLDNMKKTGLNECASDFYVDYNTICVGDIVDTHKYLMKE